MVPYFQRSTNVPAVISAPARMVFGVNCSPRMKKERRNGDNTPSGRVMQKLGMRLEGVLREQAWHRGRFVDLVHYGILRAEYETIRTRG